MTSMQILSLIHVKIQEDSRVALLPHLWKDIQAVWTNTWKGSRKHKKASLRSQGGGFTPQLDNTHQICEDSKSWFLVQ